MIHAFLSGFGDFLAGVGMLAEPGLRRYTILPLILSVAVFIVLLIVAIHYFGGMVGWIDNRIPGWLAWTGWLFWIGLAAAFVFGFYFGFLFVVGLVGLPFFIMLSGAVETRLTGHPPEISRGMLHQIAVGTVRQFPRLFHLLLWGLLTLASAGILGLIPLINAFSWIPWFLFSAWVYAVMMSDFPLGARDMNWKSQHGLIRAHRTQMFGFGTATALMSLVPVLNLLIFPAATAGITRLWVNSLTKNGSSIS